MRKASAIIVLLLGVAVSCGAQKLIDYSAGLGSRDPDNGDIWILYRGVTARHEGMTLTSDSAHFDTRQNSFTAFGDVVVEISDTTYIYGDVIHYDGNTRIVDVWDDTVTLVDGQTNLLADHITYERNRATAYYTRWGHGSSGTRTLYSQQGEYNSDLKEFYIYIDVVLTDSAMTLYTDTLVYNTRTEVAHFESPTTIYSDSSVIYSELGDYNTATRFAVSYRASRVDGKGQMIKSDTLYYDDQRRFGKAYGHVLIVDSTNDLTCSGHYGETSQADRYSYVTDSALVRFVDRGDTLYLHADTVYVVTNDSNQLHTVRACHRVKVYRRDAQAMCDSAFYSAPDSLLSLYKDPVLWYDHYQCSADTIEVLHDSTGARLAYLRSNCFAMQQVDREKFNQLKGRQGIVHLDAGEPRYADVIGNAEMVFYITESDTASGTSLIGANVGVGSSMRIYFDTARAPERVVTYDKPDMKTYPVMSVPDEWKRLKGFRWLPQRRPRRPEDVFVW